MQWKKPLVAPGPADYAVAFGVKCDSTLHRQLVSFAAFWALAAQFVLSFMLVGNSMLALSAHAFLICNLVHSKRAAVPRMGVNNGGHGDLLWLLFNVKVVVLCVIVINQHHGIHISNIEQF